jgi:hypothetical protein
MLADEKSVGE